MEQIQNAIKDTSKRSIRRIKFDIIIGMLSDDDKLFAQVKDFFQKVEMIKKYCKKL